MAPYQNGHHLIPNGEFIICQFAFAGAACPYVNREEYEITRHYRDKHPGVALYYTNCAIVSEVAAVALAGQAKVNVAKRKDRNTYRIATQSQAPRHQNWQPTAAQRFGAAAHQQAPPAAAAASAAAPPPPPPPTTATTTTSSATTAPPPAAAPTTTSSSAASPTHGYNLRSRR